MLKVAIELFLKAGLISLIVCGMSLLAKADSATNIITLRPQSFPLPEAENHLLTLAESIEALKKAQSNIGVDSDSKLQVMRAIDTVGPYQFPSGYLPREEMDNLITSLLRLYGRDEEVSAAVSKKLADLSKNIFNRQNRNSFNRFLSFQLELKISVSSIEDLEKYISILEVIQTHSSQLEMLWSMYSKPVEQAMRQRIFNQIYNVLLDKDLRHEGQFSPAYMVATSIHRFLKENQNRALESTEVKQLSDLIARFEEIKHIDSSSILDVLRALVRLTAMHPEFEGKLFEYVKKSYQSQTLIDALEAQLDRGQALSEAQIRVLKAQAITDDSQKLRRFELLKTTETRNVFQLKRATQSCHTFYGL